jgi:3-deoxy-D-manno-octulosonic-acid transferase
MGLAGDSGKGVIERAFLAPFDHPLVVKAFLDRIRPTAFILVETEIWPSLLTALKRRKIPAAIINGRLGRRTFRRYRIFGASMQRLMEGLSLVCVQSRTFAGRYRLLGVPPDRIEVLGNIKFDSLPDPASFRRGMVRASLGIPQNAWVFVAGSTRPGEEEIIARAFAEFHASRPGTMMVIAPRHLNRVTEVESVIGEAGLAHRKRSAADVRPETPPDVLILDTLGELAGVFACADAAFVGGSLRDYGGHNPLEPAALGVPVLFGPYMEQTGAKELLSGDAAALVHDEKELAEILAALMDDTTRRLAMAAAGPRVVARFTGVLARTIRCMESRRLFEAVNGNASRRSPAQ